MMRAIVVVLTLLFIIGACRSTSTADGNVIETTGTVRYIEVEGGFYGIEADDGSRYDPTNLREEFQQDGLPVRFRARVQEGAVGIHMWGQIVEILEMERI